MSDRDPTPEFSWPACLLTAGFFLALFGLAWFGEMVALWLR